MSDSAESDRDRIVVSVKEVATKISDLADELAVTEVTDFEGAAEVFITIAEIAEKLAATATKSAAVLVFGADVVAGLQRVEAGVEAVVEADEA